MRFLPTPSMAVALIALFVSLGGVSYAVATNSIDSREIKNNSVRSKDVRNNSLTGSDVVESRLGKVSSALRADAAGRSDSSAVADSASRANSAGNADTVGGMSVRKIFFASNGVPSETRQVLDLGGLVLTATCDGGNLDVNATTRVDNAILHAYSVDTVSDVLTPANSLQAEPFELTDTVLVTDNDDDELGQLAYGNPSGSSVTVNWQIESSTAGACTVTGTALGG